MQSEDILVIGAGPAGLAVSACLRRIAPRLGVAVHSVHRTGEHFTVDTSAGVLRPRFVVMVKQGKIRVLPTVQEILPNSVRFAGGAEHPFEAIADARGRPHRFGEETAIVSLYFVGLKNPPTGALREIALEAPRAAGAIRGRCQSRG